ncbi:hypothetical protein [Candidatus Uabimicrobium sp. HlEnr_7]|uniref:hypothetical protein n=1 Tax=Candidatus Uabimicrobium helgolandensis TaxID=3095367 RepID=UPI003557A37B
MTIIVAIVALVSVHEDVEWSQINSTVVGKIGTNTVYFQGNVTQVDKKNNTISFYIDKKGCSISFAKTVRNPALYISGLSSTLFFPNNVKLTKISGSDRFELSIRKIISYAGNGEEQKGAVSLIGKYKLITFHSDTSDEITIKVTNEVMGPVGSVLAIFFIICVIFEVSKFVIGRIQKRSLM